MRISMHRRRLRVLLAGLLALLCAGCSTSAAPAVDEAVRDELGQAFGAVVKGVILPGREDRDRMREQGFCVVDEGCVDDLDTLRDFARRADANVDCSLTLLHYSSAFVATRIEFFEGAGYCYRYEYDRGDEERVELEFKPFRTVELEEPDEAGRYGLTLRYGSEVVARFSLRLEARAEDSAG